MYFFFFQLAIVMRRAQSMRFATRATGNVFARRASVGPVAIDASPDGLTTRPARHASARTSAPDRQSATR
jgi:hypothetical protein